MSSLAIKSASFYRRCCVLHSPHLWCAVMMWSATWSEANDRQIWCQAAFERLLRLIWFFEWGFWLGQRLRASAPTPARPSSLFLALAVSRKNQTHQTSLVRNVMSVESLHSNWGEATAIDKTLDAWCNHYFLVTILCLRSSLIHFNNLLQYAFARCSFSSKTQSTQS